MEEPTHNHAPRRPLGGVVEFLGGVREFPAGLAFVFQRPRLLIWVILPFALTTLAFIAGAIAGAGFLADLRASVVEDEGTWYWVALSWVFYLVVLALVWFFFFTTVGSLIASPFNDLLSRKVEEELLPDESLAGGGVRGFVGDILRSWKQECIRLGVYLALLAASLPLLLVPVLGAAAYGLAMTVISIRYLAWDAVDYCLSRRRLGFRQKTAWLRAHRARTVGFGAISFLLLAVPLTTLFVLPLNAVGGSILYCKAVSRDRAESLGADRGEFEPRRS